MSLPPSARPVAETPGLSTTPRSPTAPLTADEARLLAGGIRLIALRELQGEDAAREVVQETLARTIEALEAGRVRDRAHLAAFARGVAHHVIADVHRASSRLVPLEEGHPSREASPLQSLAAEEERRAVHAALDSLPPHDRDLLRLCFFEGLSPAELALRLGEPGERVRKRKSRALRRLREAFDALRRGHAGAPSPTTE